MPRAPDTARPARRVWRADSPPWRTAMTKNIWPILIVDDEEVMCESMAAWLREDGYRVETARNGRQAVERAQATDYALYFIDLKMPGGMDGIETMMEIRHHRPEASM